MKHFYLGIVLANPFIASVSSISEQEVMPHSLAESERSDHPEHNAPPSSYEAGAPIQHSIDSGAPQPRGEAAHTNAIQPVASPNFDSVIKELLQICPPLKPWQTPLRIDARRQERAVDDAIADFFDPAPMFLKEPLRRAG